MAITINGTTGVSGVDGSASTPSYQGTDTNTGIFFPAADTIAFGEGGAEAMRINSSWNVGIGTTNPSLRLDVRDSQDGSTGSQIVNTNAGTSACVDLRVSNGTNYGGIRTFGTGHSSASNQTWLFTGQSNPLILATNFTERMRIDSSGNVGIGTTGPDAQVHVFGSGQQTAALTDAGSRGGMLRVSENSTAAGAGGAVLFASLQGDNANSVGFAAIKGLLSDGTNNTAGAIAFSTRVSSANASLTEAMRITNTGAISVGSSGTATGTSGQVLTSAGSNAPPTWSTISATGALIRAPRVLTSGTSYTTPSNCTAIYVEAVGAGGGGGGVPSNQYQAGGGGGAGAYAAKYFTVTGSTAYTYAIGSGGSGAGGNTTFAVGATTLTANGGSAGTSTTAGAGGTATNGDLNATGNAGVAGSRVTSTSVSASGAGGGSIFGGAGLPVTTNNNGGNGSNGGGGAGGLNSNTASSYSGGTGGNGLIRVWEYT